MSASEFGLILEKASADPALLDDLRDVREAELGADDELDPDG